MSERGLQEEERLRIGFEESGRQRGRIDRSATYVLWRMMSCTVRKRVTTSPFCSMTAMRTSRTRFD